VIYLAAVEIDAAIVKQTGLEINVLTNSRWEREYRPVMAARQSEIATNHFLGGSTAVAFRELLGKAWKCARTGSGVATFTSKSFTYPRLMH
jgi:hypothetical protein